MKVTAERKNTVCPVKLGESGTVAESNEEPQSSMAKHQQPTLVFNLMERICDRANLNRAYKRVKSNKGSAGVDGMSVNAMKDYIAQHKTELIEQLLSGNYHPQPVRKVMIPKPNGGERELGIPTVLDRLIQQAIHQVLESIYDPTFSESSHGFRPQRSAHTALKKAQAYVKSGHAWVVDLDLEKFFDRVNHDILMSRLARRIGDKRLLKLIRRFLTAGIMRNGVKVARREGTPQGGPLSPLLSNILLDELDQELDRRGHKFCRYADDQNIYVQSKRAGERVYRSIKRFLETKLKLKVNGRKSAVDLVGNRQFLGYRIMNDGTLRVSTQSIARVKDKLRQLSKRSRGRSFSLVIKEINQYLMGWLGYYRLAEIPYLWRDLDSWIRRRLRCYRLSQRKRRGTSLAKFLRSRGISEKEAAQTGASGKGWWRLSRTRIAQRALNNAWFVSEGLFSLEKRWLSGY